MLIPGLQKGLNSLLTDFLEKMALRLFEKQEKGYEGWNDINTYDSLVNHLLKDIVLIDRATKFFRMDKKSNDTEQGKIRMQTVLIDIANRAMMLHNQIEKKWLALEEADGKG